MCLCVYLSGSLLPLIAAFVLWFFLSGLKHNKFEERKIGLSFLSSVSLSAAVWGLGAGGVERHY